MKKTKDNFVNAAIPFRQAPAARRGSIIWLLIIPLCLLIFASNKVQANEDQKQEINKIVKGKRTPFSFTLPGDSHNYTEILKPPMTVHMRSGLVQLAPDQDVGVHSTRQNEEMLVILEGEGEVDIEGRSPLVIKGGQVVYVPCQTVHNVRNTGSIPLKYIFIVSKVLDE